MLQTIANVGSVIVAVAAFAVAAVLVLKTRQSIEKSLATNIERRSKAHTTLIHELTNIIRPHVVHCSKPEEVTREAADLIRKAIDMKKERNLKRNRNLTEKTPIDNGNSKAPSEQANASTASSTDEIEREIDFITFYGAANLSGEDGEYRKVLESAFEHELRVRRYICFYEYADLKDRDSTVKLGYFQWLARQYDTLASTPGFQLARNPRVPQWRANSATILTYDAVMEIKGNGRAAVSVHDHAIAATIRESLKAAREEAADHNKEVFTGDKQKLHELFHRIKKECAQNDISLESVAEGTHFFAKAAGVGA